MAVIGPGQKLREDNSGPGGPSTRDFPEDLRNEYATDAPQDRTALC